jgi:Flp pilus assembly protein TadD/ketosteroid isomerase-like protein
MNNKTFHTILRALGVSGAVAMLLAMPARADEMADVSKLLKAGKVAEALSKTNEFLAKHPADPQMRFMKGVLLTEQNKSEEAIAVFTKLTEDYRDLPEPYNNLAVLYAANGQYDKARVALEKAIRTNPSYMTAYENLGDVYGKMASQAYDKALALGANSAPAKSKLTLLRTFSSSTGAKVSVPESAPQVAAAPAPAPAPAAARPASPPQVALISPISPDAAKSQPMQRIPALSVTPPAPAAKVAAAPAPAPAPAPTPVPAKPVAAPVPAPVIAAAKIEPPKPAPASVVLAKVEPPKPAPAPVVVAKVEPPKPAPTPVPAKAEPKAAPKPEPVVAKAKPDTSEHDAVLGQVHGWAKAWAAQNVDGYLGYYSNEFEPPKGLSRKAWADERRARIEGKGSIRVEVGSPEVVVTGNTAKVTFRQTYVSDRLTAKSRKTLVLVKNGGKWQIKQESSGS